MSDTITYECKLCGLTFEADRWEPEYPNKECSETENGVHTYAEKHDSNV